MWFSLFSVPSDATTEGNNLHALNGSCASVPDSLPNSGNEYAFVTRRTFPNLIGVFVDANVAVDLALSIGTIEVPIFSTSKPFTYALPGDTCMTNLSSLPPFNAV